MKRAALLLSLIALSPVSSAVAGVVLDDSLYVNGVLQTPLESLAGGNGVPQLEFFFPEAAPPKTSGGVVLTENGGYASDILFYNAGGFWLLSDTGVSLSTLGTAGYTFLKETGGKQNVGASFGLAPGAVQIQSLAPTPLPPTWTLMLVGLAGLGFMLHRRNRTQGGLEIATA